jgi:hypothetical protein
MLAIEPAENRLSARLLELGQRGAALAKHLVAKCQLVEGNDVSVDLARTRKELKRLAQLVGPATAAGRHTSISTMGGAAIDGNRVASAFDRTEAGITCPKVASELGRRSLQWEPHQLWRRSREELQ